MMMRWFGKKKRQQRDREFLERLNADYEQWKATFDRMMEEDPDKAMAWGWAHRRYEGP